MLQKVHKKCVSLKYFEDFEEESKWKKQIHVWPNQWNNTDIFVTISREQRGVKITFTEEFQIVQCDALMEYEYTTSPVAIISRKKSKMTISRKIKAGTKGKKC